LKRYRSIFQVDLSEKFFILECASGLHPKAFKEEAFYSEAQQIIHTLAIHQIRSITPLYDWVYSK
jgi:hypothetical protein